MAGISQFSPQQVLEAGQRAEADGKLDYAIQFYSHVVTQHPGTPEADEAGDGLRRINDPDPRTRSPTQQAAAPAHPSHAPGTMNGLSAHKAPTAPNAPVFPHSARTSPDYNAAPGYAAPSPLAPQGAPGRAQRPQPGLAGAVPPTAPSQFSNQFPAAVPTQAPHRRAAGERLVPPARTARARKPAEIDYEGAFTARRPRYRMGRFMASVLKLMGILGLLAGLGSLASVAIMLSGKTTFGLLAKVALGPGIAIVVVAASCAMILLAQVARAVFDGAFAATPRADPDDYE